jgi:DNA-binding XRE family transcriptional regulator
MTLTAWRKKYKYTQQALSQELGVPETEIQKWETGKPVPQMIRLALETLAYRRQSDQKTAPE